MENKVDISFSIISIMGIEEHIWVVTNEGFSKLAKWHFNVWHNFFLIYRLDTIKSKSEIHVTLLWQDRQASSGTCQENALLWGGSEKARVCSTDLVPLRGPSSVCHSYVARK